MLNLVKLVPALPMPVFFFVSARIVKEYGSYVAFSAILEGCEAATAPRWMPPRAR
jgi:hypothetical protein